MENKPEIVIKHLAIVLKCDDVVFFVGDPKDGEEVTFGEFKDFEYGIEREPGPVFSYGPRRW